MDTTNNYLLSEKRIPTSRDSFAVSGDQPATQDQQHPTPSHIASNGLDQAAIAQTQQIAMSSMMPSWAMPQQELQQVTSGPLRPIPIDFSFAESPPPPPPAPPLELLRHSPLTTIDESTSHFSLPITNHSDVPFPPAHGSQSTNRQLFSPPFSSRGSSASSTASSSPYPNQHPNQRPGSRSSTLGPGQVRGRNSPMVSSPLSPDPSSGYSTASSSPHPHHPSQYDRAHHTTYGLDQTRQTTSSPFQSVEQFPFYQNATRSTHHPERNRPQSLPTIADAPRFWAPDRLTPSLNSGNSSRTGSPRTVVNLTGYSPQTGTGRPVSCPVPGTAPLTDHRLQSSAPQKRRALSRPVPSLGPSAGSSTPERSYDNMKFFLRELRTVYRDCRDRITEDPDSDHDAVSQELETAKNDILQRKNPLTQTEEFENLLTQIKKAIEVRAYIKTASHLYQKISAPTFDFDPYTLNNLDIIIGLIQKKAEDETDKKLYDTLVQIAENFGIVKTSLNTKIRNLVTSFISEVVGQYDISSGVSDILLVCVDHPGSPEAKKFRTTLTTKGIGKWTFTKTNTEYTFAFMIGNQKYTSKRLTRQLSSLELALLNPSAQAQGSE